MTEVADCSRNRALLLAAATALLIMTGGCEREERPFRIDVPYIGPSQGPRLSSLIPGPNQPIEHVANDYEDNAWALSEGKTLFTKFNCNGCHSNGGGGMGPALMDNKWIYGSHPEQVFSSIMEGRPNGMPSFRGKIPDQQVWQIAAFVRSMSGLVPIDAAPNRDDKMYPGVYPENSRENTVPVQSGIPASAEMPL